MNLIKPKKLNLGDKIKIIAPSGPVDATKIKKAAEYLIKKGYSVEFGKHLFNKEHYLAGNDQERLSDIHEAFLDKDTKAVICARGGYGALRLIDKINYELIADNPKIFCGYSDITILNTMFLKKSNLITFTGAMLQSDFAEEITQYTEHEFFNTLDGNLKEIIPNTLKVYNSGNAKGILFGGNLSTLASLCGRNFVPDTNFILLIEDINEPSYKIDRYITQLLGISAFRENLSAILLGEFINVDEQIVFEDYFNKLAKELDIPVYGGYPISHSKLKATIPIGVNSNLIDGRLKISDYVV